MRSSRIWRCWNNLIDTILLNFWNQMDKSFLRSFDCFRVCATNHHTFPFQTGRKNLFQSAL
jgi:hypothetical protein